MSNNAPKPKKIRKELISHNDIRVDEYYWLRDDTRSNKEVISYLKEENAYSEKWFAEKKDYKLNMKKYMTIQEKKTSLLIAFCTLSGGVLGNASTKDLKNLIDITSSKSFIILYL